MGNASHLVDARGSIGRQGDVPLRGVFLTHELHAVRANVHRRGPLVVTDVAGGVHNLIGLSSQYKSVREDVLEINFESKD